MLMRLIKQGIRLAVACCCAASVAAWAQATVEETVVAPVRAGATYVVSPAGARVATVTMQGNRPVVLVDNEPGPLFDQLLQINGKPFYSHVSGSSATGHQAPVVFSADGKRFAYCGREGEEIVIVVDGKEFARLPNSASALQFGPLRFSPGGQYFYYAHHDGANLRLVINGQAGPDLAAQGEPPFQIVFSRNDSRWAYVGVPREKRAETVLVMDGMEIKPRAGHALMHEQLIFSNDTKLLGVAKFKDGTSLLVDGRPILTVAEIRRIQIAQQGVSLAAIIIKPGENRPVLWLDGREVPGTDGVEDIIFSPNGKRYAALCKRSGASAAQWIVCDGKPQAEFQSIVPNNPVTGEQNIQFTADSSKLVYIGRNGNQSFAVINGEASAGYQSSLRVTLSAQGAVVGYTGQSETDAPTQRTIVAGDQRHQAPHTMVWNSFIFSPDGSRSAWCVSRVSPNYLFVEGEEQGFNNASFLFSPNSQHVAVVGKHETTGKWGLFVDKQLVHEQQRGAAFRNYRAFTPDSRHLYWVTTLFQPPNQQKWQLHLDGQPVVEFTRPQRTEQIAFAATTYFRGGDSNFEQMPFAWSMDANGVLTFLENTGATIKRFRVTPTKETSIATMLAAIAAPKPAEPPAP